MPEDADGSGGSGSAALAALCASRVSSSMSELDSGRKPLDQYRRIITEWLHGLQTTGIPPAISAHMATSGGVEYHRRHVVFPHVARLRLGRYRAAAFC
jgi:hypothetical protein